MLYAGEALRSGKSLISEAEVVTVRGWGTRTFQKTLISRFLFYLLRLAQVSCFIFLSLV